MNAIKGLFTSSLYLSLVFGSFAIIADTTIIGSTDSAPHSYNSSGSFCGSRGVDLMTGLESLNKPKFDKILEYKKQLKDTAVYDSLVTHANEIKKRYQNSLKEIANAEVVVPEKREADRIEKLGHVRSVVKNGLTLNALSMLVKKQQGKVNIPTVYTMDTLCDGFAHEAICKDREKNKVHKLDEILKGFQSLTMETSPKTQSAILSEIDKIIKSIPEDIAPEAIVGFMSESTPTLKEFVSNAENKNDLVECLGDNKKASIACGKIIGDSNMSKGRKAVLDAVAKDSSILSKELYQFNKLIGVAINNTNSDLKKSLNSYDSAKDSPSKLKVIFNDARDLLVEADKLSGNHNERKSLELLSKEDEESFKNKCDFSQAAEPSQADLKYCQVLMDKLIPKLDSINKKRTQDMNSLNALIVAASDEEFKDIENLKEYVAEKYLCSCANKEPKKESITYANCGTETNPLYKIKGLSSNAGSIADALYYNVVKMPMDKEGCKIDESDLQRFNDTCSKEKVFAGNKQVCESVRAELKVKEVREMKITKREIELAKIEREYHTIADRRSPSGFRTVKKKSNLAIWGMGLAPAIPMLLPGILGNMHMKMNIESLTQQAMYQKQMLHTYDVYSKSPWMYDYGYFLNNPFNAFPSTSTPGTGFSF